MNPNGAPGWFGKLPNVGDFASRRLPDEFIRRWDGWLQAGLAQARAEQGEGWLAGYLVAPIRRFWLASGVISERGWGGLIMPSVDRVGRHFPLTLAQPMETLAQAVAANGWFAAADAAARRVLDLDYTIAELEQSLAALAAGDASAPDRRAEALAARVLGGCPNGHATVWWCGEAGEPTRFECFESLPPPAATAAMLGSAP
jgi:type VI secretion system protein ImpM